MVKGKKTDEELAQEREAAEREAEERERQKRGGSPLTPGLIKNIPPNPAEDFASIMLTYHVSQGDVDAITKYLTDTGSDNVYFDISELIGKLMKFPRQIPPTIRRQIMDHWIAINKIVAPDNYNDAIDKTSEDYRKMSSKEKYTVDSEGNIAVATNEPNALTYDEAKKLSEETKAALKEKGKGAGPKYVYDPDAGAIRMAKDSERGGTMEEAKELKGLHDKDAELKAKTEKDAKNENESPFMQTEDGQWGLVPGAKLTTLEMMTWESMKKTAAAGQPVDPITAMLDTAEKMKSFRDLFGGGSTLPAYLSSPEAFTAAVKAAVGGDNEAVKTLNAKIDQMRDEQHAAELRQRDQMIANLTTQAERDKNELLQKMEDLKKDQRTTGKTIYDIVERVANKFPDSNDVIKGIQTIAQNPPRLPAGGGGDVSKRLESAAGKLEEAGALKKAGDAWFNLG